MKTRALNVLPSPFVFSGLRVERAFLVVLFTLLLQIVLMIAFKDVQALIVISASLVGAVIAEMCFLSPVSGISGRCKKFSDGTAVISGLVTGFLLPSQANLFLAGFASFFGLFITRNFFNGKGNAWINASVLSVIFLFLSSPAYFQGFSAFQPGASLPSEGFVADSDYRIAAAVNFLLEPLGITLPEGYIPLFFNPAAPIPAFKFNIVTLVSSIVLIALDIADWIAPAVFLAVYAVGVYFFLPAFDGGTGGNVLFALFSSGVFFVAVYLFSDFPSLPRTRTGRAILGFFAGIAAFFACGRGGDSILGAVFTVFAANLMSLIIEYAENRILHGYSMENILHGRN